MEEQDMDEDVRVDVEDVPFIAEKDFLVKYGTVFTLSFNDNNEVLLFAEQA